MTGVAVHQGGRAVQVIIGVDTHQDRHVAVAIDRQGVRLSEHHALATTYGYAELERWSRSLGGIRAFGIEGTGSYGAGVARFLTGRGYAVIEVNRPDRAARYRKGKSDSTDAEMAARAVLAGVADATPKSGEGEVEMIRMLKSAKDSAVKARTQAVNQMKALVVTAPAELREALDGLSAGALATREGDGIGRRQCTDNYKIRPIRRRIREMLGLRPRQRVPAGTTIELWLGISTDEAIRMKTSRDPWMTNRYPLIERGMSRSDCMNWWKKRYDRPLERSACVACPFQSRKRWVETKRRWPEMFAEAVEIDARLRERLSLDKTPYLHSLRRPLAEAVALDEVALGDDEQRDGFGNECEGHCGV